MKKRLFLSLAAIAICFGAAAQSGYVVVNSEKIFKAIPAYTQAQSKIEALSEQYQQSVDNGYAEIEREYNSYIAIKSSLSEAQRQSREAAIIAKEKEVAKRQQNYFGPEGEIIKRREEALKPIQERVQAAIKSYAVSRGYNLVLDQASNQSVLFASPAVDKSDEIIKLVR